MALKDFYTKTVKPGKEDEEVRLWMSFGWELKNKQRVKTQDSQQYVGQSSDKSISYLKTTKGVDFIELSFERDPERPNYKELVELEKQYYAPLPTVPSLPAFSNDEPKKMGCLWIVLAVICVPFTLGIGTVAIILWRLLSYKKRVAKWEQKKADFEKANVSANAAYSDAVKALEEAKKKCAEALEKARSLV